MSPASVPAASARPTDDLLSAVDATLWLARNLERTRAPLTTSQFRIMRRAAAGGERAARLAERLAVRKPTLTAIADGLVNAGLLLREADSADRRAIRLALTPAGQARMNGSQAPPRYVSRFQRRNGVLPAQVQPHG